ncbi:unnamed protein product [Bursaphelenchus xylophilus]|nr:unnamed protein product [Bursaphelenchus xylophilus]CAG9107271.1 unnamed protein product [Bursaphelenchus xylophilus]
MMKLLDLRRFGVLSNTRRITRVSYEHGPSPVPLVHGLVGQIFADAAEHCPDKEALVFSQQNVRKTYAEFYEDSRHFAKALLGLGLRPGDRVGIWGPNYYEWAVTSCATAMAGIISVTVNPAYKTDELHHALTRVGVKALVTPHNFRRSNYYETIAELVPEMKNKNVGEGSIESKELPDLKHLIIFDHERKSYEGAWNYRDLMRGTGSKERKILENIQPHLKTDDPINIQYTSGTTGRPKPATLSHHNLVNNVKFLGIWMGYDKGCISLCLPCPLYHCFGVVMGLIASAFYKQTCVFPSPWFDPGAVIASVKAEKCNVIYGTPTMFVDILSHPDYTPADMQSLKKGIMAGSPCPEALCNRLVEEIGMDEIAIAYGGTELSPLATFSKLTEPPLERIKSVGYAFSHCEVCIVDDKGQIVERDEKGEVLARGYNVMKGYWGDDEATKQAVDKDGWYHTGDIGLMRENGSIVICGRIKEMIIRGGENIYPAEIEAYIFKHPSISIVQVVGIPDARYGEEICAVIVLKKGHHLTEKEVREFCTGKISHYKIPKFILFKEESFLPLTATGKVMKNVLSKSCQEELEKNKTD